MLRGDSCRPTPRPQSSQLKPAQQFNSSGPIFGAMLSEWSWLTFLVENSPPPFLTPRGPTNAPSLPPFPESVSANPRCLQFRPLPPPYCFTPNTCTNHSTVHLRTATTTRARIHSPGCQAANQRAAVRIRALSDSWNRPGLHLADAAHHPPLTTEVKLLLLPCARRQPPKRIRWFHPWPDGERGGLPSWPITYSVDKLTSSLDPACGTGGLDHGPFGQIQVSGSID